MFSNKRFALPAVLALFVLLSAVLGACSSKSGGEASSSPSPTAASPSQQSQEPASPEKKDPVTLEISWWGGDTRHAALQEAFKLFQQKYDWITVKPTFSGFDGYADKLTVQLSTDNAPDVFMFSRALTQQFGQSDVLLNYYEHKELIPALAELDPIMQSPYYKFGDKLIGMPSGITSTVLVYNKKVFEEAQVPAPTDDETWLSLGEKWSKVRQANPKVFGDSGWFYMPDAYPLIMKQLGAELIDGASNPPKASMHPDKARTVWTWTEKLWEENAIPRDSSDTIGFDAGNLASSLSAASVIPSTVAMTEDPLGFATLPKTFDGNGPKISMPPVPTSLWGIDARTKHKEEALLLVNFLLTDKDAIKTMKVETGVPAVAESLEYLSTEVFGGTGVESEMLDVVKRSQQGSDEYWLPAQPLGAPDANAAFQTAFEKYLFKQVDIDGFLAEAEKTMNEKLQEAAK